MLRAVIDTNVIVSAVLFGGKPRQVIQAALEGTAEICISQALIEESSSVLRRPKFGLDNRLIHSILSELTGLARWVEPEKKHRIITEDPADDRLLDCAVAGKADYVVTGDKHLLRLGQFSDVGMVTPEEFVRILEKPKI